MQKWWKGLLFMAGAAPVLKEAIDMIGSGIGGDSGRNSLFLPPGHEAQQDEGGRYHEDVRDGLEQVC